MLNKEILTTVIKNLSRGSPLSWFSDPFGMRRKVSKSLKETLELEKVWH